MRKRLSVALLSAVAIAGSGAPARAAQGTSPVEPAVTADAAQAAPPATLRVRGTIDKYEASTRILSLSTVTGTMQLPLPPSVRIRRGPQPIEAADLQQLSGYRAVIRYWESHGSKSVESIHVFEKNERVER